MKLFMLVFEYDGSTFAEFTDSYSEAKSKHQDIECGMGVYCEVYRREYDEELCGYEYKILFV